MKVLILFIASILLYEAKCNIIKMEALEPANEIPQVPFVEVIRGEPIAQESTSIYSEIKEAWQSFKKQFMKTFKTIKEESMRFKLFMKSFLHIRAHNQKFFNKKSTFQLTLNEFSDRTPDEMKVLRGYRPSTKPLKGSTFLSSALKQDLPKNIDWREKGAVTEVKNQGQCGSCWSFSTTGSLEGQHFRKTKVLVDLSEQQLVDCCHNKGCLGCQGGLMDYAFTYIKQNHGLDTEQSYPYISGTTHAPHDKCFLNGTIGAEDTGFIDIPSGNEEKLLEAVATVGPISVAIDASHMSFQSYKDGVYDEPECGNDRMNLDHGVLLVGYGTTDDGVDYWLVKNSWGSKWGSQGYIKMSRNKQNQCGIATQASYPLV